LQEGLCIVKNIIEINGLCKSYGEIKAIDDLSFCVKEGELFAFLGVNGAGKSTTINIMCGQLSKDKGSVFVGGVDIEKEPEAVKKDIGVVFQSSALDSALSVRDNLESRAALYGIVGEAFCARIEELSLMLEFSDIINRPLGKLSGGQRRRIDIARALIHKPKILFLDEPTTGLDPQTRKKLWSVITELRKKDGLSVFLTTHYMEEAAEADRIVIIDSGRLSVKGTPNELKNKYTSDLITVYGVSEEEIRALNIPYEAFQDGYRINVEDTRRATELIVAHPELFFDYEITKGRMDDVFLAVTGKKLEGGERK